MQKSTTSHLCKRCSHRRYCKFRQNPGHTPAKGELESGANPNSHTTCKFLRCGKGIARARRNVKLAAGKGTTPSSLREKPKWELKEVDGKKLPVLDVTTYYIGRDVLKSGFLAYRDGELHWVVEHEGDLHSTGHKLDESEQRELIPLAKEGIRRSKGT